MIWSSDHNKIFEICGANDFFFFFIKQIRVVTGGVLFSQRTCVESLIQVTSAVNKYKPFYIGRCVLMVFESCV